MVICPRFLKRARSSASLLAVGLAINLPFAQADCPTPPDWLDSAASKEFRWQGSCPAARLDQAEGRLQLAPGGYVELIGATFPATRLRCENDDRQSVVLRLKKASQGTAWQQRIAVAGQGCQWQGAALQCRPRSAWPVCVVESRKTQVATVLSLNAAVQVKALPVRAPDETESAWLAQRQVAIDYCRERFTVDQPGALTIQLPVAGNTATFKVAWLAAGQQAPGDLLQCLQSRLPQGTALPETGRLLHLPWPSTKP